MQRVRTAAGYPVIEPKDALSLLAQRHEFANSTHTAFHSPLPLYVLAENKPRPGHPDWAEFACWTNGSMTAVMAYFSPVDALLTSGAAERRRYRLVPIESLQPAPMIEAWSGWFNVCLVYAVGARGQQLLPNDTGTLLPLVQPISFNLTTGVPEHFHLRFDRSTLEWLDGLYDKAGLQNYLEQMDRLADDTHAGIERRAAEALAAGKRSSAADPTHYAIYDPQAERWRYVSFDAYPAPSRNG